MGKKIIDQYTNRHDMNSMQKYWARNKHKDNAQNRFKKKNPNKVKQYKIKNYTLHKERYLKGATKRQKEQSIPNSLLHGAKQRAKLRGQECTITVQDINVPKNCPILGFELVRSAGNLSDSSPSLDRIDNSKGYTTDNIQVISMLANKMKSSATPEQLLAFGTWCVNMYGKDLNA